MATHRAEDNSTKNAIKQDGITQWSGHDKQRHAKYNVSLRCFRFLELSMLHRHILLPVIMCALGFDNEDPQILIRCTWLTYKVCQIINT